VLDTTFCRHLKRKGIELAPDPTGSKMPHCRKLHLNSVELAEEPTLQELGDECIVKCTIINS
jgi:hypothetical protein